MFAENRIAAHQIETQASNNVRSIIDGDGTALFRELTGRDYGIDAIVELFENGCVTGKIGFLQIKGKETIKFLSRTDEISCSISASNVQYANQSNIPVIVVIASIAEKTKFYYIELQEAVTNEHREKIEKGQDTITIRIPKINLIDGDIKPIHDIINKYYETVNVKARMIG